MIDSTEIYLTTVGLTVAASVGIPILNEVAGRAFPKAVYIDSGMPEKAPKLSRKNIHERCWYFICILFLAFIVGTELSLYWLGFHSENLPNFEQRAFWAIIFGFLSPQILLFMQGINLRMLAKWL